MSGHPNKTMTKIENKALLSLNLIRIVQSLYTTPHIPLYSYKKETTQLEF